MRLRAHQSHRYYHRASRLLYLFATGEEKNVPDDVARLLLESHPQKFSLVGTGGPNMAESGGPGVEPLVAAVEDAPQDRMVRRRRGRTGHKKAEGVAK